MPEAITITTIDSDDGEYKGVYVNGVLLDQGDSDYETMQGPSMLRTFLVEMCGAQVVEKSIRIPTTDGCGVPDTLEEFEEKFGDIVEERRTYTEAEALADMKAMSDAIATMMGGVLGKGVKIFLGDKELTTTKDPEPQD